MSEKRFYHYVVVAVLSLIYCGTAIPDNTNTSYTLGIFPRRSSEQTLAMFTPMADHLSRQLGKPVKLATANDFASFGKQLGEGKYDIVHLNQYHYLQSHKKLGYRVIAQNEENGISKIAGAIVVRKDSGITSLADLKGKKIVFGGGRSAMLSYIAASQILREAGMHNGDYIEQFALNPEKACIALYYRQAAAAGTGSFALQQPSLRNDINVDELRYLSTGQEMANLPWAVKPDMPEEHIRIISAALRTLHESEQGKIILQKANLSRLLPATDADYQAYRDIIFNVTQEKF